MHQRPLGNTGLTATPLGFGGAPVGFLETDADRVGEILNLLLDAGINLIDTAACYRGSEALIGQTVSTRRDEFLLVSKCGHVTGDATGAEFTAPVIAESIDRSLQRLKTDHIDVMLLHSCDLDVLKRGEALEALDRAVAQGKVRFGGYSGDNEAAAWAAAQPNVRVIETSVNLADQVNIELVLPVCVQHGVGVLAKRPIANACWKPFDDQPGNYGTYAKTYAERFAAMKEHGLDAETLGFTEADWPKIALRFSAYQAADPVAIVGTTHPTHAAANLKTIAQGPLPAETVEQIRATFIAARAASGAPDEWNGQT